MKTLKPILKEVKIQHITDELPDLSFLDQFENSTDSEEQKYYIADQQRKEEYGNSWYMIGVKAVATIHLPFECVTGKGKEINYKIQTIDSGGIWGIESDSTKDYIKDIEVEQLEELKGYLEQLNVSTENFKDLIQ